MRLLIVHHTPSPATDTLLRAVMDGASAEGLEEISVEASAALSTTAADVLAADGLILGTPANLGYMSGALKHFLDTIYYPCLHDTKGLPYGLYVHGNNDVDGAVESVSRVVTGLGWRLAQAPVRVTDQPTETDTDACWELGAALGAELLF